jgi:hypothetical protein
VGEGSAAYDVAFTQTEAVMQKEAYLAQCDRDLTHAKMPAVGHRAGRIRVCVCRIEIQNGSQARASVYVRCLVGIEVQRRGGVGGGIGEDVRDPRVPHVMASPCLNTNPQHIPPP